MPEIIEIGEIVAHVTKKSIKNVHLSVHPPLGAVRISAPERMSLDTIRVYAISKLSWIRRERRKFQEQERETAREFVDRESHYVWGRRYLLQLADSSVSNEVRLEHSTMLLFCRRDASAAKREEIAAMWYREQLRAAALLLIAKWEPLMGVRVEKLFIQRMKTRWGGCNAATGAIRLNTELAKKPPQCLEYIVVHEMTHLLEPTHNTRFQELLRGFLPEWRHHRDVLNRLPVSHERWIY